MNDELEDKDLAELLKQIPAPDRLDADRRAAILAALPKDEAVGLRPRRSRSTMLAHVVSLAAMIALMVLFGGLLIPNFLKSRNVSVSYCKRSPQVDAEFEAWSRLQKPTTSGPSSDDYGISVEEPLPPASICLEPSEVSADPFASLINESESDGLFILAGTTDNDKDADGKGWKQTFGSLGAEWPTDSEGHGLSVGADAPQTPAAAPAKRQDGEVSSRGREGNSRRTSAVASEQEAGGDGLVGIATKNTRKNESEFAEQEAAKALVESSSLSELATLEAPRAEVMERLAKHKESGRSGEWGEAALAAESAPSGATDLYASRLEVQASTTPAEAQPASGTGGALARGYFSADDSSGLGVSQAGVPAAHEAVQAPAAAPPMSPKPVEMDAVTITKSPIIMRGLVGSRSPGQRGKALRSSGRTDELKEYGGVAAAEQVAGETLNRDSVEMKKELAQEKLAEEPAKAEVAYKLGDGQMSAQRLREVENNRVLGVQNGYFDEAPAMQKAEQKLQAQSEELKKEALFQYNFQSTSDLAGKTDANSGPVAIDGLMQMASQEVAADKAEKVDEVQEIAEALFEEVPEPVVFAPFTLIPTAEHPLSTFGLDTDSAGYSRCAALISGGVRPRADMIRQEEFINAFEYGDTAPNEATFRIYLEGAYSPFRPGNNLLRVGVKGRRLGREEQRPLTLTILLDASGSMETPERMALARTAILALLKNLSPDDTVTLLTCADRTRESFRMSGWGDAQVFEAAQNALNAIRCQGATDLENGIVNAYANASASFNPHGENRVVIISDGIANLGNVNPENILSKVAAYRDRGIRCSVIGVGHSTYNDTFLEAMANRGDGQYNFLDSEKSIDENFVNDLENSFNTIASDVKIQVEWDMKAVRAYRSHGYDSRALKDEQFRDDTVDAGEVGSGQGVAVVYEMQLEESTKPTAVLGTVRIRYRRVDTGAVEEIEEPIKAEMVMRDFGGTRPQFRLACAVAEFATVLKHMPAEAQGAALGEVSVIADGAAMELDFYTPAKEFAETVKRLMALGL